jgi:N-acetylglucosamine transport system permease protein
MKAHPVRWLRWIGRRLLPGGWALFTIFIFLWILAGSLKSTGELFSHSLWALPATLRIHNYVSAWLSTDLARGFLNSVGVVGGSTVATLALSAPAAYVLSRVDFPGASALTNFFAIGIGIPVQVVLIPLFVSLSRVHLTNSLVGLSLVYVSASIPFTVFLLTGFFRSLPYTLEEAAAVDGASAVRTFVEIMLPLARPGLIAAAALNMVGLWNEFFLALTLLNDNSQYTLPLQIVNLYGNLKFTGEWGGLFAGIVIVVAPLIAAYLWLSSRMIEGLTLGTGK